MTNKVFFRSSNQPDAEYSAKEYGMYDPGEIHHEPKTETQQETNFIPSEAYAKGANKFLELSERNAIVRIHKWNEEIKTLRIPPFRSTKQELALLKDAYANLIMTPVADLVPAQPIEEKPRYRDLLSERRGRGSSRSAPPLW